MSEADKRTLKIFYIAQIAFATLFFCVAIFIAVRSSFLGLIPKESEYETVRILSLVLIVFTASNCFSAVFLFNKQLRPQEPSDHQNLSSRIRSAFILRLAIFQGLSMFGTVVFLLCGMFGVLSHQPQYFLTMAPYLLFINIAIRTFPTSERMDNYFNRYISYPK